MPRKHSRSLSPDKSQSSQCGTAAGHLPHNRRLRERLAPPLSHWTYQPLDGDIVRNILYAVSSKFDMASAVKIDTSVFNPSRIVKPLRNHQQEGGTTQRIVPTAAVPG